MVAGKVVKNDEKYLDLLNYTIGTIKCFTQSNKDVQLESVNYKMIPLLSVTVQKVMLFNCSAQKKAMILVQITGAMRNLANIEKCHPQVAQSAIARLCDIFFDSQFNSGKELILNIARLLSKVSLNFKCAEKIVQSGHVIDFLNSMILHRDSSAILIRIAYILGNLTTNFEEARIQLSSRKTNQSSSFKTIIDLACYYLEKDINGVTKQSAVNTKNKQYEEFSTGNLEDALTKILKLLANLSTEEKAAATEFQNLKMLFLGKFV